MASGDFRIGQGFDIHQFSASRPLWLGGVQIPSDIGLVGHSDADVLCHALMDALLGAAGLPDIGHFFPPVDAAWLGAKSLRLLEIVVGQLHQSAWTVVNCDITVIAELPKISPYREAMKHSLAPVLKISADRISIKATTAETLGALGRAEGMAALAVALITRN